MGISMNFRETSRDLKKMEKRALKAVQKGGDAAAQLWYEETQLRVPKETTALAASGNLSDSRFGSSYTWTVKYGNSQIEGVGVYYAAAVHEKVGAFHAPPTGAKYVEIPLLQSKSSFKKLISRAVQGAI